MTEEVVDGQLLGHGELRLNSRLEDYGEVCFYLGSSSLGEMDLAKEEMYRIARSLGVNSRSRLVGRVDYRVMRMMLSREAVEFADFCGESFSIPELERDILKEPDTALMEATNYHPVSMSLTWILPFTFLYFVF